MFAVLRRRKGSKTEMGAVREIIVVQGTSRSQPSSTSIAERRNACGEQHEKSVFL
jgi:hypothetical protein